MAVNLSPVGGVAGQFFDNNGDPLTGGKIFTYAAGTTTPQVTYTSSSGGTPHANPIILDAAGRVPSGEIWLTDGLQYKFIFTDANNVLLATYDSISGINSSIISYTANQEIQTASLGQTVFTLTEMAYQPGTNSLSVFVDGINQYGPGAQYEYLETNSTTVTFTAALSGGEQVKFTTATINNIAGASSSQISYFPPFASAVVTNVQDKLAECVSVKDFGAVGDGVTNDTDAFAAAAAYITAQGGGTLDIPPGVYIVGKQTFAGQFGLGYAYKSAKIVNILNCANPVVIRGNGAILRVADGLRYGSFNPVTGAIYNPPPFPPAFLNADYKAEIGWLFDIENCASVTITDLELDGNINSQIIGGEWGGPGRQLSAGGFRDEQNKNVFVRNFYSHHHGLDGVMSKYTVTSSTADVYPHTFVDCRLNYNGRQGMSWIGGNNITMISCDMSHTGKNGVVYSEPGAGLDIEPESSLGLNGTFINCRFYNNTGVGVVASAGPSSDCNFYGCQMIGTTNYSGWVQYPRYSFHDCTIVGSWIWPGGDATNPEDASKWYGCKFYMDPAKSPNGVVYGTRMEFVPSNNIVFESCAFYAASGYTLPFSDGGVNGTVFNSCTFEQDGPGTFFTRGNFYGYNILTHSGTWGGASGSTVFGRLYVNGVEQSLTMPTVFSLPINSNDGFAGKTVRIVSHFDPLVWAAGVGGAIRGDIVLAPNPSASGYIGSVCVTSGNPGTWKQFGAIVA